METLQSPAVTSASSILVVDDEILIANLVARWCQREGYDCDYVGSAAEALEALRTSRYELVISDVMMPGVSGLELLDRVKNEFPDVAVIMMTGVDDRETATSALRKGAFGYLIKPLDENDVLINVANALERRRLVLLRRDYERRLERTVNERTEEIRQTQEEIVLRMVAASEWRDNDTGAHIRRIGEYAAVLSESLGGRGREVEDMRLAAAMHDIGKIGVPDQILLKPGKLTDEEFAIMKRHTTIGAAMIGDSRVPLLKLAKEIALYHHEKWNGSGYPHRVKEEEIPFSARIVAVTDVYDALVHARPYKAAMPEDKAVEIILKDRNSHFQSKIVDCFLECLPEFRAIRERHSEAETELLTEAAFNLNGGGR